MTTANGFAASMAADLNAYAALTQRTMQAGIGVSDIGFCHSKTLYKLQGIAPTDAPTGRQAVHGTELHKLFVAARSASRPDLLHEVELTIKLPSGLTITAHADEIDPPNNEVTDFKTVGDAADLTVIRREGSDEQQRFQRHLYYYGAWQAGLVGPEGTVRNWWTDRAGQDAWGHVEQEPFDMNVVHQADDWLGSVTYALEHDEEVPRDKHHDFCARFCQFFSHCRGGLTHDDYVVEDPALIAAARRVYEGRKEEKDGKHLTEVGRRTLDVLKKDSEGDVASWIAGEFRVRWTASNRGDSQVWRLAVDKVTP